MTTVPQLRPADELPWPAHDQQTRAWQQSSRGGTAEDRKLRQVTVSMPPRIAELAVWCRPQLTAQLEESIREIAALDASHGQHLAALGTLLLRTESVASSKIEHVEADVNAYARALHGVRSNDSAVSMAAATVALDQLIHSVDGGRDLSLAAVLRSHQSLMRDDQLESGYAGRLRDMQNWIGGSDYSPRNALYVPPPPDAVDDYLTDLIRFTNRSDISTMAQAAIAHAQFESIHPFTDGNGRIGRALVNTVLRRRGVTRTVVVPLASALVARRDSYFDTLDHYRAGHPEPLISAFATAAAVAARESRETAVRIESFPQLWHDAVGRVRAGSATATLLDRLTSSPIFSADQAEQLAGGSTSATYAAVERLTDAGVLRPLTERKRHQVWGVALMLDELDDLSLRIAAAVRTAS